MPAKRRGPIYREVRRIKRSDGTTEEREAKSWTVRWTGADGRQRKKAAPTYALAKELLQEKRAEAAREKAGLPTRNAGDVRLDGLLERYLEAQKQRVTLRHSREVESIIKRAFEAMKAWRVRDVSPEKVEAYLHTRRDQGVSPRTVNVDLTRLKGLFSWAVRVGELPSNPLAALRAVPEHEKRHARRALNADDIRRLVTACDEEWLRLAVLLATYSGLRIGEIRALLWSDIDLEAEEIRIRPEIEKARRGAVLPIHSVLKAELAAEWHRILPGPGASVVQGIVVNPVRPLRRALERAGIPYEDETGRFADWHALRHTFLTNLARSGAGMKEVQSLGRHATPALTLGTYMHASQERDAAAVSMLPDFTVDPKAQEAAAKEGTTDATLPSDGAQKRSSIGAIQAQKKSSDCNISADNEIVDRSACLTSRMSQVRFLYRPPPFTEAGRSESFSGDALDRSGFGFRQPPWTPAHRPVVPLPPAQPVFLYLPFSIRTITR